MTRRAIIYVRCSTAEQADEGVSLQAQEDRCRAYAALRDLEVAAVVADPGVSGGTPLAERPGGARMLAAIAGGVGVVIGLKLDRLFRDAVDCLVMVRGWERAGVALHLCDLGGNAIDSSSAAGQFMLLVLAGVAEMERNRTRERTREALAWMKKNHEVYGPIPFGFRRACGHPDHPDGPEALPEVCRRLVPDAEAARTLARARALRGAGGSYRDIARTLNLEGRRAAQGGGWHASTARGILLACA